MKIHFIAIGGSVMHSLAIALKQAGHEVSGSDDRIFDPARSRLAAHGLLPEQEGWDAGKVHKDLDAIILGMHALDDNPELAQAQKLGLKVYSFPEFIFEQSHNKQRIVVAGSYGKTTVTSMIMHVMEKAGRDFNYLVGAQVEGFDNPVRLSAEAPVLLVEGDEYLASKLDPRPKFLLYQPHIVVLTGISWDHINVFPTEMEYIEAFDTLLDQVPKAGTMIYNKNDSIVDSLVKGHTDKDHSIITYTAPRYQIKDGRFYVKALGEKWPMSVIGKHNMTNISAAFEACRLVGIEQEEFLEHMASFKGASSRLELVRDEAKLKVYKDFAHAPAKVRATVNAVRELYPKANFIAGLELHTFSSLDREYLPNYQQSLKMANQKLVFINEATFAQKGIAPISKAEIEDAFGESVQYFNHPGEFAEALQRAKAGEQDVVLLMSSADFGGQDLF